MTAPTSASPWPSDIRTEAEWEVAIENNRRISMEYDLGGAIQIYRGRYFWPLEPAHPGNDYEIETPAHSLAGINRWGSQTADKQGNPIHYSVAQHAVHVADICTLYRKKLMPKVNWSMLPSPALLALRHDDPESYGFCDLTRPVKHNVIGYRDAENNLMEHLITIAGIPSDPEIRHLVKLVDDMMIFLERDELMGKPVVPYSHESTHPRFTIHDIVPNFRVWSPLEAKRRYLERHALIIETNGEYLPNEYRGFKGPF